MRRISLPLLGLLCVSPLLAHADALDGAFFMLQLLAAVGGLALLGMVFSVLAYSRPNSNALQVSNYLVNGLGLLVGLFWMLLFKRGTNPFLMLSIPFAAWLGAVTKATRETEARARMWWVAVAVAGATVSLGTVLNLVTRWLLPGMSALLYGGSAFRWLFGMGVLFGTWWMVLAQAQRKQPLGWQQRSILLVPVWATLLSSAYSYLPIMPLLLESQSDLRWLLQAVGSLLMYGLASWNVGALAVWLNQRRYNFAA
jgi:hypothetical protein